MFRTDTDWHVCTPPELDRLPRPVFVRASRLSPHSCFPAHSHPWDQLIYASSGVLVVAAKDQNFVIPPEQAVWLPAECKHSTHTISGADFRSLYIDPVASRQAHLSGNCKVLSASPLMRELILKAATFSVEYDEDGYEGRVVQVLLEELSLLADVGIPLPWPQSPRLQQICEVLYQDPADARSMTDWSRELGASSRTLARHLNQETGLTFRQWRHRLRLFKALEYLGHGESVTSTGLMLGYNAPSAFIHMFKLEYGCTPMAFQKRTNSYAKRSVA